MGVRIPGGSEDVMLDLAVRQLIKNFQRKTKELERGRQNYKEARLLLHGRLS
jgi:acyl-CoA dehydrogenase